MCSTLFQLFSCLSEIMKADPQTIEKMTELLKKLESMSGKEHAFDANSSASAVAETVHDAEGDALNESEETVQKNNEIPAEEKSRFAGELDEAKDEIKQLRKENAEQENSRKTTEAEKQEVISELDAVRNEVRQLKDINVELENSRKTTEAEKQEVISELDAVKNEVRQLMDANAELENSRKTTETEKQEVISELNAVKNEVRQLKDINAELENSRKTTEAEKQEVISELGAVKNEVRQLKDANDELKKVRKNLEVDMKTLEQKSNSLYQRISAFKDFEHLEKLNNFIASISFETRQKSCLREFDFNNLSVLLTQAGNLQKIKNLWDVCAKETISTGICNHELRELMLKIVEFYNCAHRDLNLKTIEPEIGEKFDAQVHSRTGGRIPDRISEVLFPGLSNFRNDVFTKPVVR